MRRFGITLRCVFICINRTVELYSIVDESNFPCSVINTSQWSMQLDLQLNELRYALVSLRIQMYINAMYYQSNSHAVFDKPDEVNKVDQLDRVGRTSKNLK